MAKLIRKTMKAKCKTTFLYKWTSVSAFIESVSHNGNNRIRVILHQFREDFSSSEILILLVLIQLVKGWGKNVHWSSQR